MVADEGLAHDRLSGDTNGCDLVIGLEHHVLGGLSHDDHVHGERVDR